MVKETRIIFEVKDILAFRVQCKNPKCGNEVLLRLASTKSLPDSCPMCKEQRWLAGSGGAQLLTALRAVLAEDLDSGGLIRLEIDGEED